MAARYRIGDGPGGTFVEPANNYTQDANQAFLSLFEGAIALTPD